MSTGFKFSLQSNKIGIKFAFYHSIKVQYKFGGINVRCFILQQFNIQKERVFSCAFNYSFWSSNLFSIVRASLTEYLAVEDWIKEKQLGVTITSLAALLAWDKENCTYFPDRDSLKEVVAIETEKQRSKILFPCGHNKAFLFLSFNTSKRRVSGVNKALEMS